MRLATSTNLFAVRYDGFTSYVESIKRCKESGFQVIDVNFCSSLRGVGDLASENWEALIYELRNEGEKLNLEFNQSHPVFVSKDIRQASVEEQEDYDRMMRRSILASSILGVKWAAFHPVEEKQLTLYDIDASVRKNREYFDPYVELAVKNNVGIAFENMIEDSSNKRRFSSHAGELVVLVESYNDPLVGACWDFGHGNRLYQDQTVALRTLGQHLKATHINDNNGTADDHMFPFHGTIDWHKIMPVFKEIGYMGDFTYEAHNEFNKLPEHLKDSLAKCGYEIGMYCLSLA